MLDWVLGFLGKKYLIQRVRYFVPCQEEICDLLNRWYRSCLLCRAKANTRKAPKGNWRVIRDFPLQCYDAKYCMCTFWLQSHDTCNQKSLFRTCQSFFYLELSRFLFFNLGLSIQSETSMMPREPLYLMLSEYLFLTNLFPWYSNVRNYRFVSFPWLTHLVKSPTEGCGQF